MFSPSGTFLRHHPLPYRLWLSLALLTAGLSLLASLLYGGVSLSLTEWLAGLLQPEAAAHQIIWQLRLPRALGAFACGGLLALAGALLQVLLRNPLADPHILGVSGGAAVGGLLAMLLGLGGVLTNLFAFSGAALAVAIILYFNYVLGKWQIYSLLLTGVLLSFGFSALISLLLIFSSAAQLKGMLFWLMGDLSAIRFYAPAWLVLGGVLLLSVFQARQLNVLSLGEDKAKTLGISVVKLQVLTYFLASLATVIAVMLGGTIGFVGLIIPHAVRLLGVFDYQKLLPLSALLGGSFLTLADLLARAIAAPLELPVGILTALLGVPVMLFLLNKRN